MVLFQVPSNVYAADTRSFEAVLDPTHSRMRITVTRENWPLTPADQIGSISLEVAVDGVNYPEISGCSIPLVGGVKTGRGGAVIAADYVDCNLPSVGTEGRKVRATFVNSRSLRTAVTVEGF